LILIFLLFFVFSAIFPKESALYLKDKGRYKNRQTNNTY